MTPIARAKDFLDQAGQIARFVGEPQAMALRVKIKDVLGIDVSILRKDQMEFLFDIKNEVDSYDSYGKNFNINV